MPFLHGLYPGQSSDTYLAGLEPDLLGESLVSAVLADTGQEYLGSVFDGASVAALRNGFLVLGRIALRGEKQAEDWLRQLLNTDVAGRLRPAFDAALSLGEQSAFAPLGHLLFDALQRQGTVTQAKELEPLVPEQTVSLCEVALWATQRWLNAEPDPPVRARLFNNLGYRLSDLGRREEALAAAQEAVDIYRGLAAKSPDAFLPNLAMSLNNLGGMLSDLGRREEALAAAQEAVDIYRGLAAKRPDAFLPDLAMSLNNLGSMLSELGRREEALAAAQEAVDIRRNLAA